MIIVVFYDVFTALPKSLTVSSLTDLVDKEEALAR